MRILVTGSEGLVGTALRSHLESNGRHSVVRLDVALPQDHPGCADVRDAAALERLASGCDGIVHLAAVSRVVWGERDPIKCRDVNEVGTARVVGTALRSKHRPWVIISSSREVYGEPTELPVSEDRPLLPINVYGASKAAGEALVMGAREYGLDTAVVRLSNVYGSTKDHPDRVTPAFARAAAEGGVLRLDGPDHVFDFTYIDDVAVGLALLIDAVESGERLSPIHFVSGTGTTLGELATIAIACGKPGARVTVSAERDYDVGRFVGDPRRAEALLGWKASTSVRDGVAKLVREYARLET